MSSDDQKALKVRHVKTPTFLAEGLLCDGEGVEGGEVDVDDGQVVGLDRLLVPGKRHPSETMWLGEEKNKMIFRGGGAVALRPAP